MNRPTCGRPRGGSKQGQNRLHRAARSNMAGNRIKTLRNEGYHPVRWQRVYISTYGLIYSKILCS